MDGARTDLREAALEDFAARLMEAANDGTAVVFAEAERCLAALAGGEARVLVNAAGAWLRWRHTDRPEHRVEDPAGGDGRIALPIAEGSVVALLRPGPGAASAADLRLLARCVAMALEIGKVRDVLARSVDELDVMRTVAARILSTGNLDEILLLVAHETKRLLAADIGGVMMREGDEVVMKSCVGHFSPDTGRLRMSSGIGVAGRVLATGEPCIVANYVESTAITHDFVPLARAEKVRSALAVPILSRNAVAGVLEVWRRRPSTFTDQDTGLILALAGLAAVAIDNALLLRSYAEAGKQLETANRELSERYSVIADAAQFQGVIARLMLGEVPLPAILEEAARFTEGVVLLLDPTMAMDTQLPPTTSIDEGLVREIRSHLRRAGRSLEEPLLVPASNARPAGAFVLPIVSGSESLGWLVRIAARDPDERARLALGYVALATAKHLLERRRAQRERSRTLEAILWDLLEGNEDTRAAAYDRSREMKVAIGASTFVTVVRLPTARRTGPDGLDAESRDEILAMAMQAVGGATAILGLRGDQLRMVCRGTPDEPFVAAIHGLLGDLRRMLRTQDIAVGVGAPRADWRDLAAGFREATVAVEVARHRDDAVALYGDLGILGVLVNLRSRADLRRVSAEILRDLLTEPEGRQQLLLATLRTFFDCDCSQAAAAERLSLHPKTITYRLAKVHRLTGLDPARHRDRVLLDIGVDLLRLLQSNRSSELA